MSWCCLQLGSREHYAIPSALHAVGRLDALVTDSWLSRRSASVTRPFAASLAGRRRDDIPDFLVRHRTVGRIMLDLQLRSGRRGTWPSAIRRNQWFGAWAAAELARLPSRVVFSYSYTARRPFQEAARRGMLRVLDQIDGAWREEQVWRELSSRYHALEAEVDQAPADYWRLWGEELELADVIIVNSEWSKALIVEAGAAVEKIVVVPLAYAAEARGSGHGAESGEQTANGAGKDFRISACQHVSVPKRRLQALFLGNVVLRKGVGQLFDAILKLAGEPVDFIFAGPLGVKVPDEISALPQVSFLGPVDRSTASRLYREADFFLFPTLSDGFGLTQLEALGHGLPVIASSHCGAVVDDRTNGLILPEITPDAIAESVMLLVRDREFLAGLQSRAQVPDRFHPHHLAPALLALEGEPDSITPSHP